MKKTKEYLENRIKKLTDERKKCAGIAGARHAADTGVQAGAVAAAGEDTNASFHGQ